MTTTRREGETKIDAALRIRCRYCHARPGRRCTYTQPKAINPDGHHAPGVQRLLDRVGRPTSRPHSERLLDVVEPRPAPRPALPPTDRDQIAYGEAWFDRRERAAVAGWLITGGATLLIGRADR